MRLACQEHLVPGRSLAAKWHLLEAAGFDGIELHGVGGGAFAARRDELREAAAAGVPLPTVCVIADHFVGDFDADRRRDAIATMKELLSGIAAVGGIGAITPAAFGLCSLALPPFRAPRSPEQDREVLVDGLGELADHAAAEGVLVLLEPLNRYEDHMLHTLADGAAICGAVASPALKLMGDLFHMSIEEDDPAAAIRAAGDLLAHVHLADSNRAHPGTGHTDFAPTLGALDEIGFDGYLALECGLRGDPGVVLRDVSGRLRALAP